MDSAYHILVGLPSADATVLNNDSVCNAEHLNFPISPTIEANKGPIPPRSATLEGAVHRIAQFTFYKPLLHYGEGHFEEHVVSHDEPFSTIHHLEQLPPRRLHNQANKL